MVLRPRSHDRRAPTTGSLGKWRGMGTRTTAAKATVVALLAITAPMASPVSGATPGDAVAQTLRCVRGMRWQTDGTAASVSRSMHALPRVTRSLSSRLMHEMSVGNHVCDGSRAKASRLPDGHWSVPSGDSCLQLVHDALTGTFGGAFGKGARVLLAGDSMTMQSVAFLQSAIRVNPALVNVSVDHVWLASVPRDERGVLDSLRAMCSPIGSSPEAVQPLPTVLIVNVGLWYNPALETVHCPRDGSVGLNDTACALVRAANMTALEERPRDAPAFLPHLEKLPASALHFRYDEHRRWRDELGVREYADDVSRLARMLRPGQPPAASLCPAEARAPAAVLWRESTPRHFRSPQLDGNSDSSRAAKGQPSEKAAWRRQWAQLRGKWTKRPHRRAQALSSTVRRLAPAPPNDSPFECMASVDVDHFDNWRNAISTPIMQLSGVPVVPTYEPLRRHGAWHAADAGHRDCLHWCEPSPAQYFMATAILSAAAASLGERAGREQIRSSD